MCRTDKRRKTDKPKISSFANKKNVVDDLYPVVSSYVTEQEFEELYEYALSQPHSALVIDGTTGKKHFKRNCDYLLDYS